MRYPTVDEVIRINEIEVGPGLLADAGLLESAVMRPQQSFSGEDAYPDTHTKAAALLHSLALNHPFIDGNKRTAVIATGWFYALNGWELRAEQDELVDLVLGVVEGRLREISDLAHRLGTLARRIPNPS